MKKLMFYLICDILDYLKEKSEIKSIMYKVMLRNIYDYNKKVNKN